MEFRFVTNTSWEYKQGLLVREQLFFRDFPNAKELLNDAHEKESVHLVALEKEQVVGTGRLTITDNKAIISQMTVLPNWQGQQIGKQLLKLLLEKSQKIGCATIELSARLTALDFYKKHAFMTVGEVYPSKKTGVLHQKMTLMLNT